MNLNELREYCRAKPGVWEDFPFDETTLVFKVGNKMFGCVDIRKLPLKVNLKCDPDLAQILRSEYEEIKPGYHMNKKHWNTIQIDGKLPEHQTKWLIDHSYELVYLSLPQRERHKIESRT